MPVAYSYMRFSSPAQADGDSIRRQTQIAKAWCKANGYTLDASTSYEDKGKSAFRGKNANAGALAVFLAEVEAGRIPPGSVLLIENLDRLSRQGAWDSVPMLCSIVNAGIVVVTLSPREMRYERGHDLTQLILAIVEFGRGHSESAMKAERSSAAWTEKKRRAREEGGIITRRLPAWVSDRNGKLVLNERAGVVRRMFALATQGYGAGMIVKTLQAEGVETFGRGAEWSKAAVHLTLSSRNAIGEHQPRSHGKPDGEPIQGYYPAAVDESTWQQAQAAMAARKNRGGRIGGNKVKSEVANLFGGLLRDARTGNRMLIAWQSSGKGKDRGRRRIIINAGALEGREPCNGFPHAIFENAILQCLAEIDPADVIAESPKSESVGLAGELANVQHRIKQIEEALTGDDDEVPALVATMKKLDAKRKDLQTRLAAAQQKESTPISESWNEAGSLLTVAKDEANRLRLRGLLAQIIEEVWVLVIPRKSHRLAIVQVHFQGGKRRDYLIHYQGAGNGRKGNAAVGSFVWPAGKNRSDDATDLRIKKNVAAAVAVFLEMPLEDLSAACTMDVKLTKPIQ